MSAEPYSQPSEEQPPGARDVDMDDARPAKTSYRSFKKKYHKIRHLFDQKMHESNGIYREEQRMQDISRRLAEQNDQLLDLLYDLNECPELSPEFRFDLDTNDDADSARLPATADESENVAAARATLEEAKQELRAGELSPVEYKRLSESILKTRTFAPARAYKPLLSVPHEVAGLLDEAASPDEDGVSGFVSPTQEELYVHDLDAFLGGEITTRRSSSAFNQLNRVDRTTERERDTNLRNPVSVYNWLRKHQPQVFLQDKENEEKVTKAPSGRASKRGSMQVKPDVDMYDEDGIALDLPKSSAKRKRQKDDDGGYRPKGGGARSMKRKRESGGARRSIAEGPG